VPRESERAGLIVVAAIDVATKLTLPTPWPARSTGVRAVRRCDPGKDLAFHPVLTPP